MTHGLAVRRGQIRLLCNGRHVSAAENRFTGNPEDLVLALQETKESFLKHPKRSCRGIIKRILIPQHMLGEKVTCLKCRCLMNPKDRSKYMKNVYENSWRFKARKRSSYNREYGMTVLGKRPVGRPRKDRVIEEPQQRVAVPGTLHVPTGKTLVLTFAVI